MSVVNLKKAVMDLSEKTLRKAVDLCLDNAEQFTRDARILIQNSSFGHAFALSVLAEEEIAKAWMYAICAEGVIGTKGTWKRDIRDHRFKQSFGLLLGLIYKLVGLFREIKESVDKEAKGNSRKAKKIALEKMKNFRERILESVTHQKGELHEYVKWFKKLQDDKEKALYTDINFREDTFTSPKKFKKWDVVNYLEQVGERFEMTRQMLSHRLTQSEIESIRLILRESLMSYDEKDRNEWLRWYGWSS